jgi:hypothetical protein
MDDHGHLARLRESAVAKIVSIAVGLVPADG